MSNPTLNLTARLVALPDQVEELKTVLSELIEPTRSEKGCLKYELLQNQTNPTEFIFVEEWSSEADLERHLSSTHIQKAISQLDGLIAGELELNRYNRVK